MLVASSTDILAMAFRETVLACFMVFYAVTSALAFEVLPTGCRFAERNVRDSTQPRFGSALMAFARLSEALERDDRPGGKAAAQEVGRIIAAYRSPNHMWTMLDVAHRLDRGGVDRETILSVYQSVLENLDPIARQTSESLDGHFSIYLLAHRYAFDEDGADRYRRLKDLQKRIRNGPECFERRFFLLLSVAEEIGESHGRTFVRPELETLWKEAALLKGVGIDQSPMKWTALVELTIGAIESHHFDLAEPWLAKTIKEAEVVKATPGVSAETVDIVDGLMMSMPRHFEQYKAAYQKRLAAGLE
jgi:hypothetical protein